MTLYTDIDEKCCAWMRELVKGGHIPPGDVKCASIKELDPNELARYTQVHLFCGIAGWPYALQLAGWPTARPVWTGSCPCQPFSSAGKRKGTADERHLWPDMFRLIRKCKPPIVFGEQVATAIGHGWLDGVSSDLEAEGYSVGAAVLGAHSVGAGHVRNRLFWCALSSNPSGVRPQGKREAAKEPWPWKQLSGLVQTEVRISVPAGKSGGICDGLPARVVRLRGYGNAIVPQVAAEFIEAVMD